MYKETKKFIIAFIVITVIALLLVGARALMYSSYPEDLYIVTEKEEYKVLNELGNSIDKTNYVVVLANRDGDTIKIEVEQKEYNSVRIGEEIIREW